MIPLWIPTTGPWRTGWLLAAIDGVALRVVAHVDERLDGVRRNRDLVEQLAGPGALLVHLDRAARPPVGVPDGVGAALGDPGEERLGREGPVDARGAAEAIAGNAAHQGSILGFSAVDTVSSRRIGSNEG